MRTLITPPVLKNVFRTGIVVMLVALALVPPSVTSESSDGSESNHIKINVAEGGIDYIEVVLEKFYDRFVFVEIEDAVDWLYPASYDVYTTDQTTPTLENVPAYMTHTVSHGSDSCVNDFSGPILCWQLSAADRIPVRPVGPTDPLSLVWTGAGCIKIHYTDSSPPTVIRSPVSLVPGVAEVLDGGTC